MTTDATTHHPYCTALMSAGEPCACAMDSTDRQHYVRAIRPDLHSSVPCVYRFCDQYGTAHTDPCTEDLFLIYGMTRDAYDQIQHLGIK